VNAGNYTSDKSQDPTNVGHQETFSKSNITAGATTLTVTFSQSQTMRWSQTEGAGNFGVDVSAQATGSSTAPSSGAATSTASGFVWAFLAGGGNLGNTATAGTGYTIREHIQAGAPAADLVVTE